jgi:hypothetical protein
MAGARTRVHHAKRMKSSAGAMSEGCRRASSKRVIAVTRSG